MKIAIKAEPRSVRARVRAAACAAGEGPGHHLRRRARTRSPIELDHKDAVVQAEAWRRSTRPSSTWKSGSEKAQVLLRDFQMHPFKPLILHVDFQRVAADKKIHMSVPLHFVNAEISPGVKVAGGIVST